MPIDGGHRQPLTAAAHATAAHAAAHATAHAAAHATAHTAAHPPPIPPPIPPMPPPMPPIPAHTTHAAAHATHATAELADGPLGDEARGEDDVEGLVGAVGDGDGDAAVAGTLGLGLELAGLDALEEVDGGDLGRRPWPWPWARRVRRPSGGRRPMAAVRRQKRPPARAAGRRKRRGVGRMGGHLSGGTSSIVPDDREGAGRPPGTGEVFGKSHPPSIPRPADIGGGLGLLRAGRGDLTCQRETPASPPIFDRPASISGGRQAARGLGRSSAFRTGRAASFRKVRLNFSG